MRVILLEDIKKLGRKHEVKEVPSGYARNLLIPSGKARFASPQAIKQVEREKEAYEQKKKEDKALFKKALTDIKGKKVSLIAKANEKGHLFAGIGKEEIVVLLEKEGYLEIPLNRIMLETPIKEIGEYEIEIDAGDNKKAIFKLSIEKEN